MQADDGSKMSKFMPNPEQWGPGAKSTSHTHLTHDQAPPQTHKQPAAAAAAAAAAAPSAMHEKRAANQGKRARKRQAREAAEAKKAE